MALDEPQVGDLVTVRSNGKTHLFTPRPADTWAGITFPAEAHAGTGMQIKLRAGMTGKVIDIEQTSAGAKLYWVYLAEYKAHVPLWRRQVRTIIRAEAV